MTEKDDHLSDLTGILKDLLSPGELDDQAMLGRLRNVYCDADGNQVYRHEYSKVSLLLLSSKTFQDEGVDLVCTDLKRIAGLCTKTEALRRIILKLADHINLEAVHYQQYGEIEKAKVAIGEVTAQQKRSKPQSKKQKINLARSSAV